MENKNSSMIHDEGIKKKSMSGKTVVLIILGVHAVIFLLVAAFVFGVLTLLRNSDSYQTAISYIESHQVVYEIVGEIERIRFRGGSISTTPRGGEASFTFRVDGNNGRIRVHVILDRIPTQDWEISRFYYSVSH